MKYSLSIPAIVIATLATSGALGQPNAKTPTQESSAEPSPASPSSDDSPAKQSRGTAFEETPPGRRGDATAVDRAEKSDAEARPTDDPVADDPAADDPAADDPAADDPAADDPATDDPAADDPSGTRVDSAPLQGPEMRARAAFRRGDQLYLEGDYQGAVEAFEQAYALSGRIEMLFNLANAHERLGNYERASVALRGYIPHSPAQNRKALEKRLTRFEQLAEQKRQKDQKAAEVVKELQENPQPFPVERTIGIGLITLGGAGLITGTGFALSAAGARADLNEVCESGESGRLCPADAEQTLDRDAAHSVIADVAIVSGVLLAAGGTYLLIHSRKKEKEKVELQIGVGPGRVSLGGRF